MKYIILLFWFLTQASLAEVNFKEQVLSDALIQAKQDQKLVLYLCSSPDCGACKWMKKNVFNDSGLASKIEDNFIPIQPTAKLNRMDHIKYCKILPTMLFFDENGNLVRKEEGKKTLFQTSGIIQNVIATNCTAKDEKINITSGTHKGSTCCEGLVKQEKAGEVFCTERVCIENSDRPVPISGDPRKLQCCDESKEIEILYKTFGTDVICREPRYHSNIIDESRENSKHEMPTNSPGENKNASPSVENE